MPYVHTSPQKEKIRQKWVSYIRNHSAGIDELKVITLPAAEMEDLLLFSSEGLIELEETETGAYIVRRGQITCYEKSSTIHRQLVTALAGATVHAQEIGSHFRQNYDGIMKANGSQNLFPTDVINLDFDGNLSKSSVSIEELIKLIFTFQGHFKKGFSLFLTFPQTEEEDEAKYTELLHSILKANLSDTHSDAFKKRYEEFYAGAELSYEQFVTLCIAKIIVREAATHHFSIKENDFCTYGKGKKKRMCSLLFHFEYVGVEKGGHSMYFDEVLKTIRTIEEVE